MGAASAGFAAEGAANVEEAEGYPDEEPKAKGDDAEDEVQDVVATVLGKWAVLPAVFAHAADG